MLVRLLSFNCRLQIELSAPERNQIYKKKPQEVRKCRNNRQAIVTEHTNDMVIHTDLCNRVSSTEDVFEYTNLYHIADFFLTVIFLCWKKCFGLYYLDFNPLFLFFI